MILINARKNLTNTKKTTVIKKKKKIEIIRLNVQIKNERWILGKGRTQVRNRNKKIDNKA